MKGNTKMRTSNQRHDCHSSGEYYSDDPFSKDVRIHTRFGISKTQSYAAKPEKIQINELSYQPDKFYTESLLEGLCKAMTEKINATLKNECIVCFDPAVQVHCCYLNNPRGKVDRNFCNAF